jgi:hypothetical protein
MPSRSRDLFGFLVALFRVLLFRRFLHNMEILKKGFAFRAFFKRPQKHGGHLVLCYIGLYTILQLQLVCARHHDLGKLIGSTSNNNNNNNFNENELNLQADQSPQQQHQQLSVNAQIIHNQSNEPQPPILDQKITQQSPSDVDGPNGAVLSKDDGKYTFLWLLSPLIASHSPSSLILESSFCSFDTSLSPSASSEGKAKDWTLLSSISSFLVDI